MLARSCLRSARSVGPAARSIASRTATVRPPQMPPVSTWHRVASPCCAVGKWKARADLAFITALRIDVEHHRRSFVMEVYRRRLGRDSYRHRFDCLVLSTVWSGGARHDAPRRRVSLTSGMQRQAPHRQMALATDTELYCKQYKGRSWTDSHVSIDSILPNIHGSTPNSTRPSITKASVVASRSTARSVPPATPCSESLTGPLSAPL